MKLSEIFNKSKQASITSVTPTKVHDGIIAGPGHCNCWKNLEIPVSSDLRADNKKIGDKWDELMNEPDDVRRELYVNELIGLKRHPEITLPDSQQEFANHYLMHKYSGGDSVDDLVKGLGMEKEDLGKNFRETQSYANAAANAAMNTTEYNQGNCGPCQQYVDSYKSEIRRHKEGVDNASMMTTGTPHPDTGKSAAELASTVLEDYKAGRPAHIDDQHVASARNILENFQNHLKESHGFDFNSNYDTYTPVVNDSAQSKELANRINKELSGESTGWVKTDEKPLVQNPFRTRPDGSVDNDISYRKQKQLDKINDRQIYTDPVNVPPGRTVVPGPEGVGTQIKETPGISFDRKRVVLPDKTLVFTPQQTKFFNDEHGEGEYVTMGGGFATIPHNRRTKDYDDSKYTGPRHIPKEIQDQHITEPSLKEGFNDTLPFKDKLLFQKAGIKPDTAGMASYWKDFEEFHNQPKQEPTGETKTIRNVYNRGLLPLENNYGLPNPPEGTTTTDEEASKVIQLMHDEAERVHKKEYPERLKEVIRYVNDKGFNEEQVANGTTKLDRIRALMLPMPHKYEPERNPEIWGKFKDWESNRRKGHEYSLTHEVPVMRDIPKERLIKEPPLESLRSGQQAYRNSIESALSAAYPGMDRESALKEFNKEHDAIMKAHGRRTTASKRKNMFNSRNKKEAHDPNALAQGAHWLINQGRETLDSMRHPFRAIDKFNEEWDRAEATNTFGENGNPSYYQSPPLSELGHAALGYGLTGVGGYKGLQHFLRKKHLKDNPPKGNTQDSERQSFNNDLNFHLNNCLSGRTHAPGCTFDIKTSATKGGEVLREAKARIEALAKKKICKNCGQNCSSKEECKANMDEKRRANAAENI